MPEWLLRKLDSEGHIDLAAGATRRARPARCDKCQAGVIRGLDGDMCALAADADPEPLSPEGEALAMLARIPTYRLWQIGGRFELTRRDPATKTGHPPGTDYACDVLAAHQCTPTLTLPRMPSRIPPPASAAGLPHNPPF